MTTSGRSGRSNTWRLSIPVADFGSSGEPQWPHAHASCRTVRSGSATCSKVPPRGRSGRRSPCPSGRAGCPGCEALLQPVARRRLGTVRAVLPQLAAKVRHFSLKRRDPTSQRGDQLFDFGRENHPTLNSDASPAVSKNPPTKDLSTLPVTFGTTPAGEKGAKFRARNCTNRNAALARLKSYQALAQTPAFRNFRSCSPARTFAPVTDSGPKRPSPRLSL